MSWKEVSVLLVLWTGLHVCTTGGQLLPNDTLMAIPFLFPYHLKDNCSLLYPKDGTMEYRFFFTAQTNDAETDFEPYSVHGSGGEHTQAHYQGTIKDHSTDWLFSTGNEHCNGTATLCYQCKNKVYGLVMNFMDNPTISMIAHLFGHYFDQALAIYPLLSHSDQHQADKDDNATYQYKALFGVPRHEPLLDGIVIYIMYSHTDIMIHYRGNIIVLMLNGTKDYSGGKVNGTIQLNKQHSNVVFWIEPVVSNCEHSADREYSKLQGTVIESSKPILVFTNQAKCNKSGEFSFESQLVHQMPPVRKWGTHFILGTQQAQILPTTLRGSLDYELSMIFSHNDTTVYVYYHRLTNTSGPETTVEFEEYTNKPDDSVLRIQKMEHFMAKLTHIDINTSHPILVIYNIRSPLSSTDLINNNDKEEVYYSVIVQPVNWFSNIQTVALSHTNASNGNFSYHISAVIPRKRYHPQDILVSMEHSFLSGTPLTNFVGFNGKSFTTNDYVILYLSPTQYNKRDHTHLFLWHRDPTVDIGATVFAYSDELHYAYSNGYILDNAPRDLSRLATDENLDVKVIVIIILALLLVLISLLLLTTCYCRRRRTRSYFRVRDDEHMLISEEPDNDYEYDLFILFADEDEGLVRKLVYGPLHKRSYKILWKFDSSHELFQPGADVVTDLARAIHVSRKVLLVCTKNFCERQNFHREVSFLNDVQNSERKRRVVPLVVEDEYNFDHFRKYNQIRVKERHALLTDTSVAQNVLDKLLKCLGEPIKSSTMESLL